MENSLAIWRWRPSWPIRSESRVWRSLAKDRAPLSLIRFDTKAFANELRATFDDGGGAPFDIEVCDFTGHRANWIILNSRSSPPDEVLKKLVQLCEDRGLHVCAKNGWLSALLKRWDQDRAPKETFSYSIPIRERFWNLVGWFDQFAKPVGSLALADLVRHPIWEYAIDSEGLPWRDETWVRPVKRSTVPWEEYSMTVAASLVTRSGKTFEGTAYVSTVDGTVDVPMGTIFIGSQRFSIPNSGQFREHESRAEMVAALGETFDNVFPIRWTLKILMEGESQPRSGEFSGGEQPPDENLIGALPQDG